MPVLNQSVIVASLVTKVRALGLKYIATVQNPDSEGCLDFVLSSLEPWAKPRNQTERNAVNSTIKHIFLDRERNKVKVA